MIKNCQHCGTQVERKIKVKVATCYRCKVQQRLITSFKLSQKRQKHKEMIIKHREKVLARYHKNKK